MSVHCISLYSHVRNGGRFAPSRINEELILVLLYVYSKDQPAIISKELWSSSEKRLIYPLRIAKKPAKTQTVINNELTSKKSMACWRGGMYLFSKRQQTHSEIGSFFSCILSPPLRRWECEWCIWKKKRCRYQLHKFGCSVSKSPSVKPGWAISFNHLSRGSIMEARIGMFSNKSKETTKL